MDCYVEATLDWSPLDVDDLAELAELCEAIEYFDDPMEQISLAELESEFRGAADPSRNAVVGRDKGGTIVAYGWNQVHDVAQGRPRVWLTGGVHPAWRHKAIGTHLLSWQIERARETATELASITGVQLRDPLWAGAHVETRNTGLVQLMLEAGLRAERWCTDLHRPLVGDDGSPTPLPPVPPVAPVQVVPFHPVLSEQVRAAHNEAFATRRGATQVGRRQWEDSLARAEARPQWSWVAMDGDQVVGYALNSLGEYEGLGEGWTDRLGVRPMWRRHHLGEVLLVASMRSFLDEGLAGAGLGVDTEDPETSLGLYEHLGYVAGDSVVLYGLRVTG